MNNDFQDLFLEDIARIIKIKIRTPVEETLKAQVTNNVRELIFNRLEWGVFNATLVQLRRKLWDLLWP